MWVKSKLGQGLFFFFILTSTISYPLLEATVEKISMAWANRVVLFVNTLFNTTGVINRLAELPFTVHHVHEAEPLKDKHKCPHINTVVTDSMEVVN